MPLTEYRLRKYLTENDLLFDKNPKLLNYPLHNQIFDSFNYFGEFSSLAHISSAFRFTIENTIFIVLHSLYCTVNIVLCDDVIVKNNNI